MLYIKLFLYVKNIESVSPSDVLVYLRVERGSELRSQVITQDVEMHVNASVKCFDHPGRM